MNEEYRDVFLCFVFEIYIGFGVFRVSCFDFVFSFFRIRAVGFFRRKFIIWIIFCREVKFRSFWKLRIVVGRRRELVFLF